MKKLFIVLGVIAAFITATAFFTANKVTTVAPPPMCTEVMGVTQSCTQNGNSYTVTVVNTNSYKVNVVLKAVGYRDGDMRVVWTDNLILTDKGYSDSKANRTFSTTAEDVAIKMNVYRCSE